METEESSDESEEEDEELEESDDEEEVEELSDDCAVGLFGAGCPVFDSSSRAVKSSGCKEAAEEFSDPSCEETLAWGFEAC